MLLLFPIGPYLFGAACSRIAPDSHEREAATVEGDHSWAFHTKYNLRRHKTELCRVFAPFLSQDNSLRSGLLNIWVVWGHKKREQ